jgi:two-component system cell cycle response regulator DivK
LDYPRVSSSFREGELDVYNYGSISNINASSEEKPIRILYIEDYPDNRLLIRRVLMAEGYEVIEAANAHEALKIALLEPPDLILMDINLPEVDGYTLTARIRSTPKLSHIPVVALTANVMKGDRERVLEAGCDGYIQKPVDIDQLPWQISKYLRKPRGF